MAGTVSMVVAAGVLFVIFWLALAIPTALFAHRAGDRVWIAFAVWCPFWMAPLLYLFPARTGFLVWFFWAPGAVYLWLLALRK
ncbi:hypothetical protein [Beijerinckia indica]|uniref:Transmembrane protein n=1 Tax=Beijerinckia indica subsp. indica (strain ATCC 9039 / DSM 1715 / NCIMB 8712) TaxID=395963 RepID=B2ID87_BEII9|nr:hypothetical protein [Beijerinckia indica]ACB93944.1 hypothetical protein Bind_0290 [Beijerinckia indica subsp. indica ATCC 9039]